MVCLVSGAATTSTSADQVDVFFRTDGKLRVVQRAVPAGYTAIQAAVEALIAGPTAEEQAGGIFSAIPPGVRLNSLVVSGDSVAIDFSEDLLSTDVSEVFIEAVYVQASWTLRQFDLNNDVKLTVGGQPLYSYLPPVIKPTPLQISPQGRNALDSLAGRSVTISPGHGYFWNGSGWYTQRPVNCAPLNQEDFHNLEMCQYLETYLVAEGATVRLVRCTNKNQGNHTSGHPWWQMAAYVWLKNIGYPCSVYANSTGDCNLGSGGSEINDDIRSRPLASDYDHSDIYVSLHTNGYTGDCTGSCPTGTETYYDASTEHAAWGAVSEALANNINSSIMSTITSNVDGTWTCHGTCVKNSNGAYGEIRIPDRAATLTELGFHDTCDRDADANHLNNNFFRSAAMWGMYKGICNYFGTTPTWDFYSDEFISDTIPTTMQPSQSYPVSITFRNRGVLWTESRAIRLGAVGDSDPFTAFNRVNIAGEVGPGQTYTFNFTMTAPATAGTYTTDWRMVRDGVTWFGATCSKQVQVGNAGPPSIVQHPANQTVPLGTTATFIVQATGDSPLNYQWQKDAVDLNNGGKISGADSATLQIAGVDVSDQGEYRCIVTNAHGSATSNAASLTVTAPQFMVESRSGGQNYAKYSETGGWANSSGKSTAAGVTAGIGSRYGSTYRSVAGEKHAVFSADLPVAGTYEVSVTWGANANRRTPILHRIAHAGGTTDVNVDQAATANTWVSLGMYTFAAGSDVGSVDVSNLNIDVSGSMYADAVKWVYVAASPPVIVQHPVAQNVCRGETAMFNVAASGSGTLAYQWQKNGANLNDGGHYSGVTTATLTILSTDEDDVANYRCVVTNIAGSETSNEAELTLKAYTSIVQHPESIAVCPGAATSVQFAVVATGDGTVSYEWRKNGVILSEDEHYSGVASPTLTVRDIDSSVTGTYRCLVTAGCGTAASNEAVLSLRPMVTPDFDQDCDVDQADYDLFALCISGPGVAHGTGCNAEDLDADGDVDQADFGVFQRCYSGENVSPDSNCAN
ncbi:MAG: immunoglobulin domain-containing protein [Phycisphaerae bacterium]